MFITAVDPGWGILRTRVPCTMFTSASQKCAHQTFELQDLFACLPRELLRAVVEAAPSPERCYIQLLGLSHDIRASVRGILHEMCFLSDLARPSITAEALAALVGPCKTLRKLSFPIPEGWNDINFSEAARSGWVDVTFGGHTRLAVLEQLPPLPEPVVERILSHLPGLVKLTALRCHLSQTDPPDLNALGPLSGVLKEFSAQGAPSCCEEGLAAFVRGLSVVTSLKLPCRCPPAALEPIASHLTALELAGRLGAADLPGPWLCHLETLALGLKPDPAYWLRWPGF
ncbi:hypothetical protein PAPYR_7909 [Paratrimastix pyriformis]|uniref:F-box domain-containing protein n=1 Tax=Paratrimastix pyriformis TaxID=342808 RepID=A0ABQ8UFY2_9EUKA|nr:hypothetical protein PAPYR_7909 [Paratrimastix pyriformis]